MRLTIAEDHRRRFLWLHIRVWIIFELQFRIDSHRPVGDQRHARALHGGAFHLDVHRPACGIRPLGGCFYDVVAIGQRTRDFLVSSVVAQRITRSLTALHRDTDLKLSIRRPIGHRQFN